MASGKRAETETERIIFNLSMNDFCLFISFMLLCIRMYTRRRDRKDARNPIHRFGLNVALRLESKREFFAKRITFV